MRKEETVDHNIKAAWHAIARMYNQQAQQYGGTMATGYVLLNINSEEGSAATKIAPLMGLEARSLTRILKSMEEEGLIRRQADAKDRRSIRIFLTQRGLAMKERAKGVVIAFNEAIKRQIPQEKLEVFLEVVQDITRISEANKIFSD
jgi:DNA-binding MarR family transcriptional regulator